MSRGGWVSTQSQPGVETTACDVYVYMCMHAPDVAPPAMSMYACACMPLMWLCPAYRTLQTTARGASASYTGTLLAATASGECCCSRCGSLRLAGLGCFSLCVWLVPCHRARGGRSIRTSLWRTHPSESSTQHSIPCSCCTPLCACRRVCGGWLCILTPGHLRPAHGLRPPRWASGSPPRHP